MSNSPEGKDTECDDPADATATRLGDILNDYANTIEKGFYTISELSAAYEDDTDRTFELLNSLLVLLREDKEALYQKIVNMKQEFLRFFRNVEGVLEMQNEN